MRQYIKTPRILLLFVAMAMSTVFALVGGGQSAYAAYFQSPTGLYGYNEVQNIDTGDGNKVNGGNLQLLSTGTKIEWQDAAKTGMIFSEGALKGTVLKKLPDGNYGGSWAVNEKMKAEGLKLDSQCKVFAVIKDEKLLDMGVQGNTCGNGIIAYLNGAPMLFQSPGTFGGFDNLQLLAAKPTKVETDETNYLPAYAATIGSSPEMVNLRKASFDVWRTKCLQDQQKKQQGQCTETWWANTGFPEKTQQCLIDLQNSLSKGVPEEVRNRQIESKRKTFVDCLAVKTGVPNAKVTAILNDMNLLSFVTGFNTNAAKDIDELIKENAANAGGGTDGESNSVASCNIDGVGWLLCPVVRFLAGITDAAYGYVTAMLEVPTSILFDQNVSSSSGSLYQPWSVMRNIANVAFVIVFLVIIYSQITSMGVSNYGVKKMLPRLIVAALLVNTSFWIAGVAVEISNVVGQGVYNVFGGVELYPITPPDKAVSTWTGLGDIALLGGATVATGVAVGSGLLSIAVFLPMILAAVFAILIAVIVLTLRQALIIGLVVVAPLAFVAYLLPNTEDWFKRWWKVFRSLLLLFPILALIFGVSKLASTVLTNVADTAYDDNITLRFVMQVMAAGVQIIPLFITPILMNVTQGVLGKVTGMVNNKNKGLLDRSKNLARDRQKYRNEATKAGYGRFGRKGSNKNPLNWGRKAVGAGTSAVDRYSRSRKTDMDRFDKELETGWRNSDGGFDSTQALSNVEQRLAKVKVDAEVANISNPANAKLQADVEASNISLGKVKSDLEGRNLSNNDLKQARADSAISEARTDKVKSRLEADKAELAAGSVVKGYARGTGDELKEETDKGQYEAMRKTSAVRVAGAQLTDRIVKSPGIQNYAGGIDPQGASRVKSSAQALQDKANDESVSNSISTLSNYPGHEQKAKAVEQLRAADASGDLVAARAATRYLATGFGSKGQEILHDTLKDMQNTGGLTNSDVLESIKAEGRATGAKKYDSVMDAFYIGGPGENIAALESDKNHIIRLDENQLAGQTTKQLDTWRTNNTLTKERADALLKAHNDDKLPLDDKRRVVLEAVSAGDRTSTLAHLVSLIP